MVWGKSSDRGEQRTRGDALTAAYKGPEGMPVYDRQGMRGGSRGGAPIWVAKEVLLPLIHSEDIRRRFWSRVERHGQEECWPWLGGRTLGPDGPANKTYGLFHVSGSGRSTPHVKVLAHRMAWELTHGISTGVGFRIRAFTLYEREQDGLPFNDGAAE